ncbi:DUF7344 domain-containing protein [Halobiforma nitratireducens]|uniref:DUF7344 domain-containing protein n=1 Tax=Halobiforma nitratireducens JCM 10879 TaxID=1227454 RepID=M0M5T4_9EURY|nr:hypothetical protein [Halobiforma nitratireducens]EMA41172.1 hypothetical protein C446_06430 [Halobiforma nitratireducens JCM 10879]
MPEDNGGTDRNDGDENEADRRPESTADADLDPDADAGEDVTLTPGVVFGLLADRRDRFLLYLLYERGGTVPLSELTAQLTAWENETTSDLLTEEMKRHTRTSLVHASLPKLADYDLVTFNADTGAVTLTERGEWLEPYLEFAKEQESDDVDEFLDRSTR